MVFVKEEAKDMIDSLNLILLIKAIMLFDYIEDPNRLKIKQELYIK